MEQISKIRKCYSCGATLQTEDPSKEGYVHSDILDNPNQNFLFCDKCFEIERFRSTSNEPMINEDFKKIIEEAKKNDCLIVYVVNLLFFETSFSKEIVELLKDMKVMVVGMKYDLLPKTVTKEKISEYVAHRFRVAGIKTTCENVSIVSKTEDENIREVLTKIFELKNGKSVYVIGSDEAGKTSLIQGFLKIYSNLSNGTICTHEYKDTNLKVMDIPLTNRTSMYETPGISITNSIRYGMDSKTFKSIFLTKPIEPRTVTISEGHSLFIGGLAVVELEKGPKTPVICYFHENVQLRKNHLRNIEEKFVYLNNRKALTPSLEKIKSIKDMEVYQIEMQDDDGKYRDIGISGLGWITMPSMNQKLKIYLPKGVSLYTSRPKIEVK